MGQSTKWYNEIIKTEILDELNKKCTKSFVYHYTNLSCLLSILENKELWLSERNSMNDKKDEDFVYDFCKQIVAQNNTIRQNPWSNIAASHQYVFSTSLERDSIHQWAYYSAGDGVCISFYRQKLIDVFREYFEDLDLGYYYGSVLYTHDFKKDTKLKNIVTNIYKQYIFTKNKDAEQTFQYEIVEEYLYSLIKQFGHHCEKEYRFVITEEALDYVIDDLQKANKTLKKKTSQTISTKNKILENAKMIERLRPSFRSYNGLVKPYIKFPFEPADLISSIMIGPSNHEEIAKQNLEFFLKSKGLEHIKITKSIMSIR